MAVKRAAELLAVAGEDIGRAVRSGFAIAWFLEGEGRAAAARRAGISILAMDEAIRWRLRRPRGRR